MAFINLSSYEIYPLIRIYDSLLPDSDFLCSSMDRIEKENNGKYIYKKWDDWYSFGKYCSPNLNPSEHGGGINAAFDEEFNLFRRLRDATTLAVGNYVTINNVPIPDGSILTYPSLARYYTNVTTGNSLTMQYHTDFVAGEWYWPGEKFLITATTYLNDNYDGGEIVFFIDGEKILHKPKAGTILVFPSGSPLFPGNQPYFHGVQKVTRGTKYLVRNYLKYTFNGTKKWFENENLYGKETWNEMAREQDRNHNIISFDESGNPHMSEVLEEIHRLGASWISEQEVNKNGF
jgi:hypothetical protein